MIKSKKQMFIVIGVFTLVMLLGTVTYAFFNYTRTGAANTISVGRISFVSRQTQTISLTNLFPIDPTETGVMDDDTKVGTLEIEIEGDTDYAQGVEYLISTSNAHINTSEGRTIPISLRVDVEGLGNSSDSYFTAREAKNANIYKRLSGDVIVGDQQLLVGYIKPNTTSGQVEGVNGTITIKAYLDKNKIAITDTYDGTESDNMGTTNNWVDDRTVITTEEWNALQNTGISFQVKIEANEGIWVDEPIYNTMRANAVMDNIQSTNVSASTGIDFSKISGDTDSDGVIDNGEGLYVRAGTETDAYPIMYYRGNVTNNNVYFAGKCWQIVRTTDTGGTKMIYNGENTGTEEVPACEPATGADRQITLNINGTDKNGFTYSGTNLYSSTAYNGYMWSEIVYTQESSEDDLADIYFGTDFTYDNTTNKYLLVNTQKGVDDTHRYTCNELTANATCESVRYYVYYGVVHYGGGGSGPRGWYYTLSGGKSIEETINEMQQNKVSSNAKIMVDKWYEENLNNLVYSNKIEDTIYCNDRSTIDGRISLIGNSISDYAIISYSGYTRAKQEYIPSLNCRKNDSFTVRNSNGNMSLDYPIGLITSDEVMLAGGKFTNSNENYYLKTGANYWIMTPFYYDVNGGMDNEGIIFVDGEFTTGSVQIDNLIGLRPVISLKQDSSILSGDGTGVSPYIIK